MFAVLAFCLLGPVFAVEYASTDVPKTIPDESTITSTITIADTTTITDLDVKLNLNHSFPADLVIYLIGPGGSPICTLDYHQWWWATWTIDDEGGYTPATPLSVFDGMSLAGTWTLQVVDEWGGDSGILNGWSLLVNGQAADEDPPVVAITSVSPTTLWPPNNKMVAVTVTGTVTDADSGVANAWIEVADEYGELDGTFPVTLDADGNFTLELSLMASRHGSDADGRTYVISLYAVDNEGNEADPDTATVTVPHDQRRAPAPE